MKRLIELIVGVILCTISVHTFAVMGLVAPVQVSAGSMAPHWLGPHWKLACGKCGARYEVGTDAPPQAGRTECPACGATVLIGDAPRSDGDALLVDRTAFLLRSPRRWEPIVFRCPDDAKRLCVKRIIGLPGERISLGGGDVYVNGRLIRKSLDRQRALRVPVDVGGHAASRWRPSVDSSCWTFHAIGMNAFSFDPSDKPGGDLSLDLLTYTVPGGEPISDSFAYNAGVPAIANPTADLALTGTFLVTGRGELRVRCGDPADALWIEWDSTKGELRLTQAGRLLDKARLSLSVDARHGRRAIDLELSLFDQQVAVTVEGRPLIRHALGSHLSPTAEPFAIGAAGTRVRATHLAVWRDVVYTPRPGGSVTQNAAQATWQLAADEYFVLGDNPAISDDSRTWRSGPGLPRKLIIGRAMGGR